MDYELERIYALIQGVEAEAQVIAEVLEVAGLCRSTYRLLYLRLTSVNFQGISLKKQPLVPQHYRNT